MSKFKVGQKVRCIDNSGAPRFYTVGVVYTVKAIVPFDFSEDLIRTEETEAGMFSTRFEAISETQEPLTAVYLVVESFGAEYATLEEAERRARYLADDEGGRFQVAKVIKHIEAVTEIREAAYA